jgi:transcriptional regulator with XRE-family HTH domain
MIKTDQQLDRTIEDIRGFAAELQSSEVIEDELERQLVTESLRGMIHGLLIEVAKYRDAKAGRVRIPNRLNSIHDLCPYLTSIRIAIGWSQENLANQVSVTRQCVNRWEEHNYRGLDADTMDRVVLALGVHTLIRVRHDTVEISAPIAASEFNFERELRRELHPALA